MKSSAPKGNSLSCFHEQSFDKYILFGKMPFCLFLRLMELQRLHKWWKDIYLFIISECKKRIH